MYQQPQQPYGVPQPFAAYAQYAQQQAQNPQQPQFGQGGAQPPMPFQFSPYPAVQQPQPNNFQNVQQGASQFNPQSMAMLQQQQQQQFLQLLQHQQLYQQSQQHYQPQPQQHQHQPPQAQTPAMNFDQVKAQLDLLRNLSGGNQGPPPS
jgi:H/ACA ribonucleoprotein complex non-core subunit NAF1